MASNCPSLPMHTGKPMPMVGLGTWLSANDDVKSAVKIAIKAGYRHIDTARIYFNEGKIGEALDELIQEGVVTRDELFITTKLAGGTALPNRVKDQTEDSLKLLKTEYIDLLLIHFPVIFSDAKLHEDPPVLFPEGQELNKEAHQVKPIEVYREMEKLVDAGLVKALGLSNFNKDQIQKIWNEARIKPSNLQCECHAWFPQDELVNYCKEKGITFSAYGPIGSPGRPWSKADNSNEILLKDPTVVELAGKLNKTPAQILMKYLLQRGIIVLPKSTNKERIISNFQLFDFTLSDPEMEQMRGLNRNKRLFEFVEIRKLVNNHPEFPWKMPTTDEKSNTNE